MATAAATTGLVRVNHTAQTTGVQRRGVHNVRVMMPLGLRSRNSCVIVRAGGAFLPLCASCVDSTLVGGEPVCRLDGREGDQTGGSLIYISTTIADEDEDFEARLAALKKAKGETPYGAGVKKGKTEDLAGEKPKIPMRDYSDETLYFESGPHMGDLAVNVALGTTLVWLPLSIAAVGRAAFVKYRFTDRRLSTITTAPWKTEQLDAAYDDVIDVKSIGRGVGVWGDMVVTLKDGSKVEMRAVPKYRELQQYILDRRDALKGSSKSSAGRSASNDGGKGGFQ